MGEQPTNVEFRVLGPLEVKAAGRPVALAGGRARPLLADLVLNCGRVLSVDRLVDDLWGERPPRTASAALQNSISQLRRALAAAGLADLLVTRPPGYVLDADPDLVDAARFERLLGEGRSLLTDGDAAGALVPLQAGLALWRGAVLPELTDATFVEGEAGRLEELRLQALEARFDAELALGAGPELVAELERLTAEHPLRERLWAQLMRALYHSGRQADALAAYRAVRRRLDEDLGLDPGPELRALEQAILRQERELSRPRERGGAAEPAAERRRVIALVCDLGGALAGGDGLDPERWEAALGRVVDTAREIVARHGGALDPAGAGTVVAFFGAPEAREDDAVRAARAALELRAALARLAPVVADELGIRLEPRLALDAQDALVFGGRVSGNVVAHAGRLAADASPGEIAVGPDVRDLLGARASTEPTRRRAGLRLLGVEPEPGLTERRPEPPLAGRLEELAELQAQLAAATREAAPRAIVVSGAPGVGKSRLGRELARTAGPALVLGASCGDAAGAAEALRSFVVQAAGADSAEAIAASLPDGAEPLAVSLAAALAGAPAGPGDLARSFRRWAEAVAAARPLVLMLDDADLAPPALVEALDHLLERARGPILVVCLARGEPHEVAQLLPGSARLPVLPLPDEDAEALADRLLADAPAESARRREAVLRAAEGNPLFLEHLCAHLAQSRTGPEGVPVPPTLLGLLGARVDALPAAERAVLERAAIVGREFTLGAVADLLPPAEATAARRRLDRLVRRGLVEPAPALQAFADGFRFRHGLIHETALERLPKQARAELHEQHADLLDRRSRGSQTPVDEAVGRQLERAFRLREELGRVDRHARRLAQDAGARLAAAGMRAWRGAEVAAAVELLRRALDLLPPGEGTRPELLCELAVAQATAGNAGAAWETGSAAVREARAAGDARVALRGRLELAAFHTVADPVAAGTELVDAAEAAIPVFEALEDDRSLGRAWLLLGWYRGGLQCRNAEWRLAAEKALVHYGRAGWPATTCLGHVAAALYYGPAPVPEAIERCEELSDAAESLVGEAHVLAHLGALEAMRGDPERGAAVVARARELYEDVGQHAAVARTCAPLEGAVALLAGDEEAAERALRAGCERLERLGDRSRLATVRAGLADVLLRLERPAEAEEQARASERGAGAADTGAQLAWRTVRCRLLARAGRVDDAEALAGEAIGLAERTDWLDQHAAVLLAAAEVADAGGRRDEAERRAEGGLELLRRKGNATGLAAARRPSPPEPPP